MAAGTAGKKSTDIVVPGSGKSYGEDELAGIVRFDDAIALVATKLGGESEIKRASEEIGDGFKLLDNKDQLVGVGIFLVTWDFHQGEHGEFVSVKLITKDNQKFILNDGSTGIRDQLMSYSAKKNKMGGLVCDKGLRRSDYKYTDDEGKEKNANTYYLDTSA